MKKVSWIFVVFIFVIMAVGCGTPQSYVPELEVVSAPDPDWEEKEIQEGAALSMYTKDKGLERTVFCRFDKNGDLSLQWRMGNTQQTIMETPDHVTVTKSEDGKACIVRYDTRFIRE